MEALIHSFRLSLESLDRVQANRYFDEALALMPSIEAIEQVVVPALIQIGSAWEAGDVALSQVYMGGRFCEELVDRVLPPSDPDRKNQPRSAIVVLSDYHMLGKRIVYSVMRASGFELFDYGRMDLGPLVERTLADNLGVLLVSTLMLPSALKVKDLCSQLKDRNPDVRIMAGGAPFRFDPHLWREVGVDAVGNNAAAAVSTVEGWMGGKL